MKKNKSEKNEIFKNNRLNELDLNKVSGGCGEDGNSNSETGAGDTDLFILVKKETANLPIVF